MQPRRFYRFQPLIAIFMATALSGASFAQDEQSKQENIEKFKDWSYACETVKTEESEQEVCGIAQNLIIKESGKTLLKFIVREVDGKNVGILSLPLGIDLLPGVKLKIDDGEEYVIPVRTCQSNGCLASWPIEGQYVDTMKLGKALTVTITALNGKQISIGVSLSGFTAAYSRLHQ